MTAALMIQGTGSDVGKTVSFALQEGLTVKEFYNTIMDRLGDVGQGFHIALEVLNSGRLGLGAASARGARMMRLLGPTWGIVL